jgi:hypothetical protein
MGTYEIIGLENRDGSVSLWHLVTDVGNVLMIFSDEGNLAEVLTYAERHGKGPDQQIVVIRLTVDSPAQIVPEVEGLRRAGGGVSVKFVTEGEEIFDDLLVQIRKQNAVTGGSRVWVRENSDRRTDSS